jgi:hypothetical protein
MTNCSNLSTFTFMTLLFTLTNLIHTYIVNTIPEIARENNGQNNCWGREFDAIIRMEINDETDAMGISEMGKLIMNPHSPRNHNKSSVLLVNNSNWKMTNVTTMISMMETIVPIKLNE